ncbi:MAG: M12 family metallo-peptidase [Lysobacteraceae bacterium]
MKRSIMFIAIGTIATLGFAASASQAAKQPLFSTMKAAPAGISADAAYRALAESRATGSLQMVQADASQISAKSDTLQLGFGDASAVHMRYTKRNPDGTLVWYGNIGKDFGLLDTLRGKASGEIADDPNNSVMIVRNGDKLTGTIRKNGELYALRPLRSGGHVIAHIDETKMPADHPAAYNFLPQIDMGKVQRAARAQGDVGPLAISTIRVMVVATQSAANASGDIVGLVNLAVAESNQGYANSGVEITLQLAGRYTTTYVESGSFSTDLTRFRGTTDGYMDSYHATRNTVTADVMMLLINNASSCGLASGIGSTASTAFAVAHYGCATGYYSFAHEIGHLQSARHDIATDPTLTPYAYGHGYRSPTNAWRTIMAYACTTGGCPRINYWSNPAKTYGGQAMGNTTRAHNQRVLNTTKATIAAFR